MSKVIFQVVFWPEWLPQHSQWPPTSSLIIHHGRHLGLVVLWGTGSIWSQGGLEERWQQAQELSLAYRTGVCRDRGHRGISPEQKPHPRSIHRDQGKHWAHLPLPRLGLQPLLSFLQKGPPPGGVLVDRGQLGHGAHCCLTSFPHAPPISPEYTSLWPLRVASKTKHPCGTVTGPGA